METGRGMGRSVVAVDIAGEWTFAATDSGDPFGQLRQLCSDNPIAPNPLLRRFGGGLIGWFSYDLCRVIERIPTLAADDLQLPLCYFQLVDSFIEFDHQRGVLTLATLPVLHDGDMAAQYRQMEARLQEMMEVLSTLPPPEARYPTRHHPRRPACLCANGNARSICRDRPPHAGVHFRRGYFPG
ncbi:MAG: Aminodeoxychorismate synthase component 1 [Chlorobi bacterium OLB7]|nr:MAG: Aminodeoxychorismate synthase component 1 [Chlorobi bacterium OLB7]